MKFGRKLQIAPVFLTLAVSLCLVGAAYAAWSDNLNVTANLTTGSFQAVFQDSGFQADTAANINAAEQHGSSAIAVDATVDSSGTAAELTIMDPLNWQDFTDGTVLVLRHPLEPGENSTVSSIAASQADLSDEPIAITFIPESVYLVNDGIPYSIDNLPADWESALKLSWDAYRSTESGEDGAVETYYLTLKDPGALLNNLPDLTLSADSLPDNPNTVVDQKTETLQAQLEITYSFDLPISVEQSR